jgi:GNAT superfamily N-acetyltransferase
MHSPGLNSITNTPGLSLHVRPFSKESDSIDDLTILLNKAYKSLADAGFRYVASYQDSKITLDRIKNAACFIGTINEKIVATISYYDPANTHYPKWQEDAVVAHFGQFAVDPSFQGSGIGNRMLAHVEDLAKHNNVDELALDTAENAAHLVSYYNRKGYRFVTYVQWKETNYRSVILSKQLADHLKK